MTIWEACFSNDLTMRPLWFFRAFFALHSEALLKEKPRAASFRTRIHFGGTVPDCRSVLSYMYGNAENMGYAECRLEGHIDIFFQCDGELFHADSTIMLP
jgi:hypothetical protein